MNATLYSSLEFRHYAGYGILYSNLFHLIFKVDMFSLLQLGAGASISLCVWYNPWCQILKKKIPFFMFDK